MFRMRWCANNCIFRFIYRHLPVVIFVVVLLLSANQVVHFSKNKSSPTCYKIVSPFANPKFLVNNATVLQSNNNNGTENDSILPNIDWSHGRFDDRRMVRILDL